MVRLREQLVERLVEEGALRSEAWRGVFAAVPRHLFVPSFFRKEDGSAEWHKCEAGDAGWGEGVYADTSLATQLTDGVPTSSSSQPGLMALMLEALDVRDGDRVLEVATGTGYNAALLSERLGSGRVTSVEVDAQLAATARARLSAAGYRPTVHTGDGREGYAAGAPYDRLIATCGFASIPYAWIRQVRPGGVLVVPLGLANVRLVVSGGDEERSARGHFLPGGAYFMSVREAGATGIIPRPDGIPSARAHTGSAQDGEVERGTAELNPEALTDPGFRFVLALALPDVTGRAELREEGELAAFELWDSTGAWARVDIGTATVDAQPARTVRQSGRRRLWDAVERIHHWYAQAGHPAQTRFGLTVTEAGETVWLDKPTAEVPLPGGE